MNVKYVSSILVSLLLNACSGDLYTVKDGVEEKGVFIHPQMHVIDVYKLTKAIDKKGDVIAELGGTPSCVADYKEEIVVRTDYASKPMRLFYDSAFLEQFKFSATLKDGVLESVNMESTPDRGETLKNIASAAKDAASIAAPAADAAPSSDKLLCNAAPRYQGTYQAPNIRKFSEKPN